MRTRGTVTWRKKTLLSERVRRTKNRSLISQTLIINHLIIVHIYKCTHRHASICAHALGTGAYRYLPEIIDYIHLCTCVVVLVVSKDMRAVLKLFLFINLLTVSV